MTAPLAKLIHPDGESVVTAGKAYISGEPIQLGDKKVGVYMGLRSVANGEKMAVQTKGIYEFPCATGVTFSVGAQVHWNIASQTVVATADSPNTFPLGRAHAAKTSGQLVARVDIGLAQTDDMIDVDIAAIP